MSQEKLLQAQTLIREKRFNEARELLLSMPNDPTAQKWLAKLNEMASQKAKAPRKSPLRLVIISVGALAVVAVALVLLWVFVLSDDDDGGEARTYTEEDLRQALLTLDDMPSGWSVKPPEEDEDSSEEGENEDSESSSSFCGHEIDLDAQALVDADVEFSGGEIAPLVTHGIGVYSSGEAERIFTEFTGIFETCQEWQDEDEWTWHAAEISFPKFGDNSAAFRISTSDVPLLGVLEMQFVLIQDGNLLNMIMLADIGVDGVDAEQTEDFVRRADEKLRSIAD